MTRRLSALLLATLALGGCVGTEPQAWACGVPHCSLERAPGVRLVRAGDARWLLHEATGARVHIDHVDGTATPGRADEILAEWRARLSPVVNWSQPPQHAPGFVVRGLTGDARPPPGVFLVEDPDKVWLATYENPATGSVLLLRAEAPASVWDEAWADLGPVVTRVSLSAAF